MWIILSVIFSFYDLEISKQIADQNSSWAIFLENFGMIPGIFIILSGIFIYYSSSLTKTDVWSYIQRIVFFLVCSGLIFYMFDIFFENAVSNYFISFLIVSFFITIKAFVFSHLRKQEFSAIAIKYAKVVIGMGLFGYVIGIQVIKYFWGRVRFRELDATFSQFTPWYLPQGISGYDSFPSGHAAMGWMLLALLILFINKQKWIKVFVSSLIVIGGIVLASSRVVVGAHYASDILFGSFFIILIFLLLLKRYKEELTADLK